MNILFSIIMPTYNRKNCIKKAIDSALAQTYENYELVIVDDGSNDDTDKFIEDSYAKEIFEKKIKYVKLVENAGASFARNEGLKTAKGSWITYLDSDNEMRPDFLETIVYNIQKNQEYKIFYSQIKHINSREVIGREFNFEELMIENFIDLGVFVHSQEVYQELGGFNVSLNRFIDWDLIIRYVEKYKPKFVRRILLDYYDGQDFERITNSNSREENYKNVVIDYYKRIPAKEFAEEYKKYFLELGKTKNELLRKEQELREKKQEIAYMKGSHFWKLRDALIDFKDRLEKHAFLGKFVFVIVSFRKEGFTKMLKRIFFFIFYGEGVLNKKELKTRREERERIKELKYSIGHINSLNVNNLKEIEFEKEEKPLISIIFPVFNQWQYSYNCLGSLKKNIDNLDFEIIVVDDGSTDETKEMMNKIKNVVYLKNEKKLGFVGSCNAGAKKAKGEYVVFLNNNTSVKRNWLGALLETFQKHENIGLVGSKLINPDGTLQEAGGIVWKNEKICSFGEGRNPADSEYNYFKDVDYCSGASIMLPRNVFEKLGGFDETFSPGYFEDIDLVFRVRQLGLRTVYQPESEVFHFKGITPNRDLSAELKKYQVDNSEKFFDRWRDVLEKENFQDNSGEEFLARDKSKEKKVVLFVDHRVPSFDRDAGSFIAYEYLKILSGLNCKVVFWSNEPKKMDHYEKELQKLGIEVRYGQEFFEKYAKENGKFFEIVFVSRPTIAGTYLEDIEKYFINAKIAYIGHDLHFLREGRAASISNDEEMKNNSEDMKNLEFSVMNRCDLSLFFSDKEVELVSKLNRDVRVEVIPWIQPVIENEKENDFNQRKGMVFLGNFLHSPNADAVKWFHDEIFPLVKKKIPNIVITILGNKPSREILKMNSKNFNVLGYTKEEDIPVIFNGNRMMIAPLRFGAGFKGKIAKAMSFGLPVVTTEIGAEGIGIIDRETALVADDAQKFAEKIIELYLNEKLWNKISKASKEHIENNFSVENAEKVIEKIMR